MEKISTALRWSLQLVNAHKTGAHIGRPAFGCSLCLLESKGESGEREKTPTVDTQLSFAGVGETEQD